MTKEIILTEEQKRELTSIGDFYRKSAYSQHSSPDILSCLVKNLEKNDGEISQTIITELLLFQRLIQNKEYFAILRDWLAELDDILSKFLPGDVSYSIECRLKSIQSALKKMIKNLLEGKSIDLYDLVAFRIILDSLESSEKEIEYCYQVKDICIEFFKKKRCTLCAPSKKVGDSDLFKDYIAYPKPKKNYQSLHLAFKTLEKDVFECQIRTLDMHEHAEIGDASHGEYKDSEYSWLDPYIFLDVTKIHIPNFRRLHNGSIYDQIGLVHALQIQKRPKMF